MGRKEIKKKKKKKKRTNRRKMVERSLEWSSQQREAKRLLVCAKGSRRKGASGPKDTGTSTMTGTEV